VECFVETAVHTFSVVSVGRQLNLLVISYVKRSDVVVLGKTNFENEKAKNVKTC
jgi:hypothetical protein